MVASDIRSVASHPNVIIQKKKCVDGTDEDADESWMGNCPEFGIHGNIYRNISMWVFYPIFAALPLVRHHRTHTFPVQLFSALSIKRGSPLWPSAPQRPTPSSQF